MTINAVGVIDSGGYVGILSVPDTSPSLSTITVDGASYALVDQGNGNRKKLQL